MTPPTTRSAGSQRAAGKQASSPRPKQPPTKQSRSRTTTAAKAAAPRLSRAGDIAHEAANELAHLLRRDAGAVTQVTRDDDRWVVHVEVVELSRIRDTTDVLGLYEVTTDAQGDLQGYRRLRRYLRGAGGDQ